MKRYAAFLLFLLFILPLHSSMLIFDMNHPVYEEAEAMYIAEGKTQPLGIKPWSDTDVRHMLESINPVTEFGKKMHERISGYLEDPSRKFKWGFDASLEPTIAIHHNTNDFPLYDDWYNQSIDDALAHIAFSFSSLDYVAGFVDLDIGTVPDDATRYDGFPPGNESPERHNRIFSMNIPFLYGTLNLNAPSRAYFSIGFDLLRFTVGRDRLSWGNGMTGNMMLGDTLPWHDYASLTFTGSDFFHYQMLISFFAPSNSFVGKSDRDEDNDGIRFFLGHRFELDFFGHRLKIVANEAIMYYSSYGYVDYRIINPLFFLHDLYIAGNANSLMTFELEWAPMRNWTLYAQVALDDIHMPTEPKAPNPHSTPDQWGAMVGGRGVIPYKEGYFYTGLEFVYTSPFIYHRGNGTGEDVEYNLYYVSSLRVYNSNTKAITRYLSFPFGSDAIAALFRFGYSEPGKFNAAGNVFFMAHGIITKNSKMTQYQESGTNNVITSTPSVMNPFDSDETGVAEYSLIFGGEGEYILNRFVSLNASLYFNLVWNKDYKESDVTFDTQFSFGVKVSY